MKNQGAEQQAPRPAAKVVVTREEIAQRVRELAGRIAECYRGEEVTILAVLTGSVVFLADLIRHLAIPLRLEVAQVSSYPEGTTNSHGLRFTLPLTAPLAGRHVLILDDILDSGKTLTSLVDVVRSKGPASVRTCVLLRKSRRDLPERPEADFVGFDVPDEFVIGYGLDFNNLYRNLPDLCVLEAPESPAGRAEAS